MQALCEYSAIRGLAVGTCKFHRLELGFKSGDIANQQTNTTDQELTPKTRGLQPSKQDALYWADKHQQITSLPYTLKPSSARRSWSAAALRSRM